MGGRLYTIESADPGASFGEDRNVASVGDLDGDGAGEIAVATPWGTPFFSDGFFEIYRGADGSFLRNHFGEGSTSLGSEVTSLGDVDGDGVPDYAACNFERGDEGGYVAGLCSRSMADRVLRRMASRPSGWESTRSAT